MPQRTSYPQGVPSWVDLRTTDQAAAKSFYGELFGWEFDDQKTPDGAVYSMATKNGGVVAAIASQPQAGVPPMWNTYLAVDDVDAAAARVEAAGGKLLMPPFDVMDAGRMCFATDPSGAAVGLWQAKEHIGATLVNEPGAVIWNELVTDNEAALPFYDQVFGSSWAAGDLGGGTEYVALVVGGERIAGTIKPQAPGVPNHWHVYFAVAGALAATERVTALGGTVLNGPFDTPIGPMAQLRDPQGGMFSIFEPKAATA
ncbi:VOC family protein [Amycolatopsis sp. NPDC059657]|uniref:VOC family protein n=1 Tax=Amycolatopsis sp. NPDC059657 TaxID=3346899 RepID=UPI00366C89E2